MMVIVVMMVKVVMMVMIMLTEVKGKEIFLHTNLLAAQWQHFLSLSLCPI